MSNTNDGVIVPELPNWLRQKFAPKEKKQNKKIWISRENSATRKIVNENEVFLILKGWTVAQLETFTLQKQINLFAEASHIVAAHGAGLVNLLWSRAGTKVIEIQDKNMLHKKVYSILSYHLGLNYKLFTAHTIPIKLNKGKRPKGIKRLSDLIHFKLNVSDLIKLLD
jgi:capsular polysaccharide biosynthesis protein